MSDRMRVLMVNSEMGWRGGERVLDLLLRHLPPSVRVTTACPEGSALADHVVQRGWPWEPLSIRHGLDIPAIVRLRELARHADIVHAQTSHAHGIAALAMLDSRIPLLVTRHLDYAIGLGSRWKYNRATHIAAVSQQVAMAIRSASVPNRCISVIRNGIDVDAFDKTRDPATRAGLGIPEDAPVVVSIGQLTAQKDPHLLLNLWTSLQPRHPDARLLLVGTGDLEAELRARHVPGVVFAGFRKDIPDILNAADIFVLCSRNEGLPLAVMEAMAAGLPVIATRAGGTAELIDEGVDGHTTAVGDGHALSRHLDGLLRDPSRRRAMGNAARDHARQDFSAATMAGRYASLYHHLITERP